jgi:cell division septation protein DedD
MAVAPRDAEPKAKPSARSAASGDYWVQVAAFHEPKGAARLATQLRGQNFSVTESTATLPSPTGKSAAAPASAPAKVASRYDVLVTGASAAEITPKLTSNDLSAEAMGNDVIVKPSLPLAAATNLSKSLAAAGYKVQVRRAPGGETEQAAGGRTGDAAGTKAAGSDVASPVYRVRVGPFPDRATAAATLQELEAKGYKPFIAKGQP